MKELVKSKGFVFFVVATFILFITPVAEVATSAAAKNGQIVGFIYAEDGPTPVEGAVFLVQNIKTKDVYESKPTTSLGAFNIKDMEAGIYLAGVKMMIKPMRFNMSLN
ncbi:MAG: hypothetical protein ABIL68_08705 [bacterium]